MARANVALHGLTLLNRWPVVMHEIDWRFNQLSGDKVRMVANCQNHVYIQYERDYIAQALYDAAVQAREYLGYAPAPMWVEDEVLTLNSDYSWSGQTVQTRYGKVQAFGKRAATLIETDATVTFEDTDDDGLDDTATITVSGVEGLAADEIQVFFRVADGAASAGSEEWRIEPLTVSVTDDEATITGPRWLFAHPEEIWDKEYRKPDNGAWLKFEGDASNPDHFVVLVDVYRVYADATSAVQLLPNPNLATSPVSVTADIADSDSGSFTLRTVDAQEAPGARPGQVKVSYMAGLPLTNGRMDAQLERAIIGYANTLMPQMPECCDRAKTMWDADMKQSNNAGIRDAWNPPAFGITEAGMKLKSIVDARWNPLKGKITRVSFA